MKKQNILLVEPPYDAAHLPLGLQKIAAYHLKRGDNVDFIHDHPKKYFGIKKRKHYNRIYITSVFTFQGKIVISTINYLKRLFPDSRIMVGGIFATLMHDYVKKKTGIEPHRGLYMKVENIKPFYGFWPVPYQINLLTSRGCINNCDFCAVSELEPEFGIIPSWKDQIMAGYEHGCRNILIVDNNFNALRWSHQKEVAEFIGQFDDITCMFGALDCRIFKDKHAKLLKDNNWNMPTTYFSFDGMWEDQHFQRAMALAMKYELSKDYTGYLLYNHHDKPEELWYRLNECLKMGVNATPLKYVPLNALSKNEHIGEHWTQEMLRGVVTLLRHATTRGITLRASAYKDHKIGRTADEFMELITSKKVSTTYFRKLRESKKALGTSLGLTDRGGIKESRKKVGIRKKKMATEKKLEYRTKVMPGQIQNKPEEK